MTNTERDFFEEIVRLCRIWIDYKTDGQDVANIKQSIATTIKYLDDYKKLKERTRKEKKRT